MDFVKSYWKEVLIAVLAVMCYLTFSGKNRAEETSETLQHTVTQLTAELTKTKSEIIQKNQTVTTVTKKADGTTITETKKTSTLTKENETTTVKEDVHVDDSKSTVVTKNDMERYSVGVDYAVLARSYNLDLAARLGDLPFDAVIRSENNFHDVALGVRFKW